MTTFAAPAVAQLLKDAEAALGRRDVVAALAVLTRAEETAPRDVAVRMLKAAALRLAGDLPGSLAALDAALAIDPYHFVALLSKGALLEQVSGPRIAARVYQNCLELAPPDDRLPPGLAAPLARARQVVADNAEALAAFMQEQVAGVKARHGSASLTRFDEALDIYAGRKKVYVHQPVLLNFPQLPAVTFHDRDLFPWLPRLEAATDTIRAELKVALEKARDEFSPYVTYPAGAPVGQWGQLNHSMLWSSLWLWKDGQRQEQACAQCPETAALLESLPMAWQPGFGPTAVFSALEAHTRIPPHTGSTNARLLVHLPLILPGPAGFRVGNQVRHWRMGEAWVFDDSIDHEAWNDADELRVILIFDTWNPYLTEAERDLVSAMMLARNQYYAGGSPT